MTSNPNYDNFIVNHFQLVKIVMVNNLPSWQPVSENYSPVKIAILAPRWLQEALSILLLSEDSFLLVANTRNEDVLFSLPIPQLPDIIVIDADRRLNKAVEQITRVKTKLNSANYLMLVDQTSQYSPLTEAGADAVILKGSPPSNILEIIRQIAEKRGIEAKEKSDSGTDALPRKINPEV
jgi:DNA-binding NarL/FixJ family response regulator